MRLLLLAAALSTVSFANPVARKFDYSGLGKKIQISQDPFTPNKLAFGITFSLGANDPDGDNWLIDIAHSVSLPKGSTWNLLRMDSKQYEFSTWKASPAGPVFSARLSFGEAQSVLPHQKELVFVFKVPSGELMYLPIGEMCEDASFETYFKNLTDSKRCYEVSEQDVLHN